MVKLKKSTKSLHPTPYHSGVLRVCNWKAQHPGWLRDQKGPCLLGLKHFPFFLGLFLAKTREEISFWHMHDQISKKHCKFLQIEVKAGLGTPFFSVLFCAVCYVLFRSKKECSVLFFSFLEFLAIFPFFSKERKRMQRTLHSFEKNGKERKECSVLLRKRMQRTERSF